MHKKRKLKPTEDLVFLVVDDESRWRTLLGDALEEIFKDCKVYFAKDAVDALEVYSNIENTGRIPDAIISDWNMKHNNDLKKGSGKTLSLRLRAEKRYYGLICLNTAFPERMGEIRPSEEITINNRPTRVIDMMVTKNSAYNTAKAVGERLGYAMEF